MTTIIRRSDYRARPKISFGDFLYRSLALLGWVATTALTTAGLFVALFVLAGNGTLASFFEQGDLLARHYLEADVARRAAFDVQLLTVIALAFACAGFFRRTALIAIIKGAVDGPPSTDRR
jgi:hypothetical protein